MDLLIRRAPALVCASLLVLAGCGSGSGAQHRSAPEQTATPPVTPLPQLRTLLPAETRVLARSGASAMPTVARWRTSEAFVVYGVCSGGGKLTFADRRSDAFALDVPCDGVISRSTVYSRAGQPVTVGVAGKAQRWKFLISRLEER